MTAALMSLALCLIVGFGASRANAAAYGVDSLAEAGASLEFRAFEGGEILSMEPLTGHLVLRNDGTGPLEYKASLLTGASIVMKVFQDDGSVVDVPLRGVAERGRGPAMRTLAPGEEAARVLIFPTADSVIEAPGVYRAAFALTDNGLLQSPDFLVTVNVPVGEDLAVLEAMRAIYPDSKNPVSFLAHTAGKPEQAYLEHMASIVRAHPTSRYAALIAKDLMEYMGVIVAPDPYPDTEHYLGIAAAHGSRPVSERARFDLARIALAAGRHAQARQYLASLATAAEARLRAAAALLMRRLQRAEAGGVSDISPTAMMRMARLETANIMTAIGEYYAALIAGDAARLGAVTGRGGPGAQRLLDRMGQRLSARGIDALVAVTVPAVSAEDLKLQAAGQGGRLYSVQVDGIRLTVDRAGVRETLTTNRVFRLRRGATGNWLVHTGR